MKKNLLLILFFLFCYSAIKAQDSQGGTPYSFNNNKINIVIDLVQVPAPDIMKLQTEDLDRAQKSEPYRIGVSIPVDFSLTNSGTWTDLPEINSTLWQLTVKSAGAKSISFGYGQFYLPEGAKLFVYNKSKNRVIGAYTSINNTENFYFSHEKISGDEITLELIIPDAVKNAALLNITELNYFYRSGETDQMLAASDPCEVNINCTPEGTNWQQQKLGVCKLDIRIGANWFNCSGSLVNNTSQNCTPYVLLADHCHYDAGYASTADYAAWVFYFHYEATTCTGTTSTGTRTKTACTLKAHDTYGSNNSGSDFLLVQINTAIITSFNVFYNGWDRNNTASTSGVGIHHPAGDIMKISTYTSTLLAANVGGTASHWQVTWAATTNGHGVTEGGSSGSPLFNAAKRIVGTLTGGSSYCTATGDPDYYGKFYNHWDKNGSTAATRLKDWLDPTNSNVTTLDGRASCATGISENSFTEERINIYPSPAQSDITIDIRTGDQSLENIQIYNVMGALVYNIPAISVANSKAVISIEGLAYGVYYITAIKNKTTFKGQFIKTK